MIYIATSVAVYFLGFLVILCLPTKKIAVYGWIATAAAAVSLASVIAVFETHALPANFELAHISLGGISASFGFVADTLSLLGVGLVSFVALLVFLYAHDYMSEDSSRRRFFAEFCLFAGAMTGIIISPSLLQMFIFWEIVGLSSYLLIGFWFEKPEAATAAQKVFTLIMLGDVFLLAGILLLGVETRSWDFSVLTSLTTVTSSEILAIFLILCGAMVKSAQAPFSFWLPWAMEGPTPVSALLHSATMVKAGAFLVLRMFPLVALAGFLPFIIVIALVTSITAGISALAERDIKRILAYSTVAQLGFIFLAIGLGDVHAGMFHLISDAFYKALLFLAAGVIIHLGGSRDIYSLSRFSFKKNAPILILAAIGILGITGFPPFGAFFSKDAILDAAHKQSSLVYALALFSAFLTSAYIFRWVFLISRAIDFKEEPTGEAHHSEHMFGWKTKSAMGILALGVVSFGIAGMKFFSNIFYESVPELDLSIVGTTLVLFIAAVMLMYFVYVRRKTAPDFFTPLLWGAPYAIAKNAFWFAAAAELIARFGLMIARTLSIIDTKIIDGSIDFAVVVGRALARAAAFIDTVIINRALNGGVAVFIQACFGAEIFDRRVIDGYINDIASYFKKFAELSRLLVNGLLGRYMIAFTFGTLGLIIYLRLLI